MLGDRLGKWIIYKELGRGGMGRVYLAQEEIGGKKAALKVLAAELAQEAGFLQRFQREIDTLSQLDHPHIVRLYESGLEDGHHFYAMEYIDGESLDEILAHNKRLPWSDVLDIVLQICPALKHVHDHGIIHRDLKPANLLRTSTGVVKLTDFGIAKVFAQGQLTATGGVLGTAEYISPEQAAGKPITKRSDLYSLGAVLYTLLTGRPPFVGESFVDLLHKHRYAQFDLPRKLVPDIPYEMDEVICQLLEKDPAKRPPDCLVLTRQFESIRRKLERKGNPTRALAPDGGTVADNTALALDYQDGAGPATLMSRLIREELDRQNRGGPLAQLFNRWYVVVPLFLLVLGILVWSFWPPSADTLYERGAALMQSENPADWDQAWREYLEPLQRRHPDHPHRAEVEGFRKKIEARQRLDDLGSGTGEGEGEGQRLFRLGEKNRQDGDLAAARRLWANMITAFKNVDSEKDWVQKAQKAVADLDKAATDQKRLAPVKAALKQAAGLWEQNKRDEADAIWRSIEELYRHDPAAAEFINEIQAARNKALGGTP